MGLLLFVETQAVDYSGAAQGNCMNDIDREILARWNESGFVKSGRICYKDVQRFAERCGTEWSTRSTWVQLSDAAWTEVARLRKERAGRMWVSRNYKTTDEKRVEENTPEAPVFVETLAAVEVKSVKKSKSVKALKI